MNAGHVRAPQSRGTVSLASDDPLAKIRVQRRFLSSPGELDSH